MGEPKSYRPIFLLCVLYKILKWIIYTRVEPIIDPLLPMMQARFQRGKSTVNQFVLLTQNIKGSFKTYKKVGVVLVKVTAAYDPVWHCGFNCKFLRLLPDKYMIRMIIQFIRNRSFTLATGVSKQNKLRCLKNGVSQRSVLALLFLNIYTYNLPFTISRKFAYADDLL